MTTTSKIFGRKTIVIAVVAAVAVLAVVGISSARAAVMENTMPYNFTQMPDINGTVSVGKAIGSFIQDNAKISFVQASQIAANQVGNGTLLGGHIGVVQGYLVYTFFAMDMQSHTGHLIMVDAGDGKVLYTSTDQHSGFGMMSGQFGPWGMEGGNWHGQPGPWGNDWHGNMQWHHWWGTQ